MAMAGTTDLDELLRALSPTLVAGEYRFCTFPGASYGQHAELDPIASFVEAEGLTLVVPTEVAVRHGLPASTGFRCITLGVHSSLEAVGLTAAVSTRLTALGISANVIAAHFHDHVFVPTSEAGRALDALRRLGSC